MANLKYKFKKTLLFLMITDIALFSISYAGSFFLRFDFKIRYSEYINLRNTLIPLVLLKVFIFYHFDLYKGMWRYTSLEDLVNIIKASFLSSVLIFSIIVITTRFYGFARSVFLIDCILSIFLIGGFRLVIRLFFYYRKKEVFLWRKNRSGEKKTKRVLIVGAGDAGEKILREINDNRELVHYEVLGFLDDDPKKIHRHIHGIRVLDNIQGVVSQARDRDIDEIIIAIPSACGEKMRRIVDLCQKAGVRCKTIPGIGELINGKVSISTIRDVSYCDLLGRRQVELDMDKIGAYLKGKCVLVTGAGGSIGSEFCRQVAMFEPKILILLDRAESSLYDIEMELRHCYPKQKVVPVLGSVTCLDYLKRVFNHFEPQVVFHAAAYKHVPMMEMHPWEAVYNNILGTKNVLEVSLEAGAERFVLVSTDKAVRPTNIMGASKRVAEIIVQLKHKEMARAAGAGAAGARTAGAGAARAGAAGISAAVGSTAVGSATVGRKAGARKTGASTAGGRAAEYGAAVGRAAEGALRPTKIMAVRFGNVIGSAGSVIPLFKKQIAQGGPVTVTDPEVTRYFMTINEAVQLILQAGAMGESGDIYILKMGRPVKILDMARDLIRLSGFEPDKDIRIEITGLRPGEKLYEELISKGEGIVPTSHKKLLVLRSNGSRSNGNNGNGNSNGNGSSGMSYRDLEKKVEDLLILAKSHDGKGIQLKLWEIVPEYKPQELKEEVQFMCEKIVDLEDEEGYGTKSDSIHLSDRLTDYR